MEDRIGHYSWLGGVVTAQPSPLDATDFLFMCLVTVLFDFDSGGVEVLEAIAHMYTAQP